MADLKKRGGLGRGLDALLGDIETAPKEGVVKIALGQIKRNPSQPRKDFDEEKIKELAASIARHGVVQPIIVRKDGEQYVIVTGERRWRAAKEAGLKEIPAIVREFDDVQVMEVSLIENIQRENLNPVEEAAAIRFLMRQHDLTQEEVSARLGKSRPAIANTLRLLSLCDDVQKLVREGKLSSGHGRTLAGVSDPKAQAALAKSAVEEGWSVRELEQRAKAAANEPVKKDKKQKNTSSLPAELYDMEERMRNHFGTKVKLSGSVKRGRITIDYFSRDELERIYDLLGLEEK